MVGFLPCFLLPRVNKILYLINLPFYRCHWCCGGVRQGKASSDKIWGERPNPVHIYGWPVRYHIFNEFLLLCFHA